MTKSAKKGWKKVCKCWSLDFRSILMEVLGFVDVFGLRFVVLFDCAAKCEVKVNLVMWVCGR
jgi:hypothetical protein